MRQLLFILSLFVCIPIQSRQDSRIYVYDNGFDLTYFQGDKVVFISLDPSKCESLLVRDIRKCFKELKKQTKVFRNGQISPSDIYEFSFYDKTHNDINFTDIKDEISPHNGELAKYLEKKGFQVMNLNYFEIQNDTLKCQFHLGARMNCQFYNFQVSLKSEPFKLTPYKVDG